MALSVPRAAPGGGPGVLQCLQAPNARWAGGMWRNLTLYTLPPTLPAPFQVKLLIVEDSATLRDALQVGLRAQGMAVDAVGDGETALAYVSRYSYDVIILDLLLPHLSGTAVLQQVRNSGSAARVLVLSALDDVSDKVHALNLGADDFLAKPFDFEELLARTLALGRRASNGSASTLAVGALLVDGRARVAAVEGRPVPLSPKEYLVLETLLRHRGECLTRSRLFELVYENATDASDAVIEVLVSTLRAKLARSGCPPLIETRRGFGYRVP